MAYKRMSRNDAYMNVANVEDDENEKTNSINCIDSRLYIGELCSKVYISVS